MIMVSSNKRASLLCHILKLWTEKKSLLSIIKFPVSTVEGVSFLINWQEENLCTSGASKLFQTQILDTCQTCNFKQHNIERVKRAPGQLRDAHIHVLGVEIAEEFAGELFERLMESGALDTTESLPNHFHLLDPIQNLHHTETSAFETSSSQLAKNFPERSHQQEMTLPHIRYPLHLNITAVHSNFQKYFN